MLIGAVDAKSWLWDFPGGPVVKNLSFHCRGCGFNPSLGTRDLRRQPNKKKSWMFVAGAGMGGALLLGCHEGVTVRFTYVLV